MSISNDEVKDRAEKWVRFYRNLKWRNRMDEALAGLSDEDARRVYLCGQRMAGGLALKILPATTEERSEPDNGNNPADSNKPKATRGRKRTDAAKQSAQSAQG